MVKTGKVEHVTSGHRTHKLLETWTATEYVKPLTLKTAHGIWNILPHSKIEKIHDEYEEEARADLTSR